MLLLDTLLFGNPEVEEDPLLVRRDYCRTVPWQTSDSVREGTGSVVVVVGIAGFWLDRTTDDTVDPVLRGAVMASHCGLHLLTAVYTVVVRLTDPFSPSGLFALHTAV